MKDDVGVELEGTLQDRGGDGVVDDEEASGALGELPGGAEVSETHQGIRGRLADDRTGVLRDGIFDLLRVARVDVGEAKAEVRQDAVEKPGRSAVHILSADDLVAGFEKFHD